MTLYFSPLATKLSKCKDHMMLRKRNITKDTKKTAPAKKI